MATGLAIRLLPETQRSLSAATIAASAGTYLGIGTAISNPARIFYLQNLTDVTLQFSFDGINDNFPLAANGFILLDATANQSHISGCYIAQGQRIYVKTLGTPASGAVYLTVFYGANG